MQQEEWNIQYSQVRFCNSSSLKIKKHKSPNTNSITDYMGSLRSLGKLNRKGGLNEDATIYRKLDIENLKCVT